MKKKTFTADDFYLVDERGSVTLQKKHKSNPASYVLRINQDGTITLAGSIPLVDKRFQADSSGRIKITEGCF